MSSPSSGFSIGATLHPFGASMSTDRISTGWGFGRDADVDFQLRAARHFAAISHGVQADPVREPEGDLEISFFRRKTVLELVVCGLREAAPGDAGAQLAHGLEAAPQSRDRLQGALASKAAFAASTSSWMAFKPRPTNSASSSFAGHESFEAGEPGLDAVEEVRLVGSHVDHMSSSRHTDCREPERRAADPCPAFVFERPSSPS